MMRCETLKELMEAYVEGELDESERKAAEVHIASCESCKRELALTRSIPRLVSSLPTPPVPDGIIPDTLEKLHERQGLTRRWLRSFGALLSRRWQFAATAFLVLSVVLFGISYEVMIRQPEIAPEEVASAVRDLKLALGIMGAATQRVQSVALEEGTRALDMARSTSDGAMRNLYEIQLNVSENLQRSLAVLSQLKEEVDRP